MLQLIEFFAPNAIRPRTVCEREIEILPFELGLKLRSHTQRENGTAVDGVYQDPRRGVPSDQGTEDSFIACNSVDDGDELSDGKQEKQNG